MDTKELIALTNKLISMGGESELIEFKHNFHSGEEIGIRLSALSNSAALKKQAYAYLVFGVDDASLDLKGTNLDPNRRKFGSELLEQWLINRLSPRIDFNCYRFQYSEDIFLTIFRIPAASFCPVKFMNCAYIRINSCTRKLTDFPEKEAKIWKSSQQFTLDKKTVKASLSKSDVAHLLSTETYFTLLQLPQPETLCAVMERFEKEKLIISEEGQYSITALGALLFAKDLSEFDSLARKAVRVIVYKGSSKIETIREFISSKGYALAFTELVDWVNGQLPSNEEIGRALRTDVKMYPDITIRELIANCIIHQNVEELGFPMVEIYSDRVEISNPGAPLIENDRFIDEYVSRNVCLADIMRRMGFCEEKGSGLDKIIYYNEFYQLPAIKISSTERRTTIVLYAYKQFAETNVDDRIRACYQHACLRYVSNDKMTNQSLRERFKIEDKNYSQASRIIKASIDAGLIKESDGNNKSRKFASYLPYWA